MGEEAPSVPGKRLSDQWDSQLFEDIANRQRHALARLEKTNEMLEHFFQLSSTRIEPIRKELLSYVQILTEMKRNLDFIYNRLRSRTTMVQGAIPTMVITATAVTFIFLKECCLSVPLPKPFIQRHLSSIGLNATNKAAYHYLKRYGYLNVAADGSTTDVQFAEALKLFQRIASLPVTGVLCAKTIERMSRPRCRAPDVYLSGNEQLNKNRRKRYVVEGRSFVNKFSTFKSRQAFAGSYWASSNLTYSISRYSTSSDPVSIEDAVKKAFRVWEQHSLLRFKQVPSRTANIDIAFVKKMHGDGEPFDGRGGILAHAFFPQYGGSIHFDDDEAWNPGPAKGLDLYAVAAHEIGHSLGLKHSMNSNALMAPFYQSHVSNEIRLHSDDVDALHYLYGSPAGKQLSSLPPGDEIIWPSNKVTDEGNEYFNQQPNSLLNKIDICKNAVLDTITVIGNGSTYAFQGKWYWRLNQLSYDEGYPRRIADDWDGLPDNLDAAVTDKLGNTYFFKEDKYWQYDAEGKAAANNPKNISSAFPDTPENLDAAMIWAYDQRFYFFKGKFFWQHLTSSKRALWPRLIKTISSNFTSKIDAAFTWTNGKNYIFAGPYYYRLSGWRVMKVLPGYPRSTGEWWFGCNDGKSIEEP
ncbi:Hemopexin [Trichuris suis]|nr:Hemopexin [Trichuris suis]